MEKSVPRFPVCHHSASLVMSNGDPRDGLFYPTLTLMIDSYIINTFYYVIYYNTILVHMILRTSKQNS